uniref:Glial cell line-derived neurotrophic factor n=1 Tax=Gasterosteus aculeatus TaxID=69293 RepID=G3PXG6_GASAC
GTESKMKLWDVLATCLLLLSSVASRPLYQNTQPAAAGLCAAHVLGKQRVKFIFISMLHAFNPNMPYDMAGPFPEQFDDVMDFIEATIGRLRRSSEPSGASKGRREQRQRAAAAADAADARGGKGGRGDKGRETIWVQTRGCLLKEVHLNVTDLGLGYQTKEELIFRYCSGSCAEAETNYDKILNNLTHNKKLDKDTPSRTCCRPIAFDDDLSFLDDNVVYHTLKKHSARKCACV